MSVNREIIAGCNCETLFLFIFVFLNWKVIRVYVELFYSEPLNVDKRDLFSNVIECSFVYRTTHLFNPRNRSRRREESV